MSIRPVDEVVKEILVLDESDRIRVAQRILESLQEKNELVDLKRLRGVGKGIWGSAEAVDRYINEERSPWDR